MCGICGFTGFKDDELLHRMTDVIKHRGPDGEGYYTSDEVNLGVRRLAIIDLKTGDQPIYNEDKSIVVIFNGEIYNYLELRKQLESKGHRFYTNTDTEVIVHLYEEYKENCVQYLCGMFAFAIWDSKEKQLFLARDRLGIKPLFYSQINGSLIFSSEIKSILECKKVSKDINLNALDQYLTFLYIPSPLTIFKEIFQLPPASYLIYKNKDLKIYKYWDLIFDKTSYSEDFYIQNLDGLLEEVIKQHLISDVPIGIFLSGGIDSSTISVYASKIVQSQLNAFTIGYLSSDKEYNELNKASLVSKKLGLNYFEYIVNPDSAISLLPDLIKYFDQPFADSSSIVTYLISKLSSEKLTVALTGIGGDELFCGYPRYQGMEIASFLPKFRISERIINWLPESYTAENKIGRFKRFLYGLNFSTIDRYISFVSYLQVRDKLQYYTDEFRSEVNIEMTPHRYFFKLTEKESLLDRIMYTDINTYLVDELLCLADRMSMANSIELRVPFCDHRIVEFVAGIPTYLRLKRFSLKYLLKKLLKKYLPEEIIGQKKMGFMVPLARWLRDIFNFQVEDFIRKKEYSDYLNYEFIRKMWDAHITYKKNYSDQIWSLLVLDRWKNTYNIELPKLKERYKPKTKKLKILMVSDIIFEDVEGGSGRMVTEISNELAKRGHIVFNLTRQKKGFLPYQRINSREVYRYRIYPENLVKSAWVSYFDVKNIINKILENNSIDIINYHHPLSGFIVRNIKKIRNIPQVYNFYSPWHVEYEIRAKYANSPKLSVEMGSYIRRKIEKNVLSSCEKIILLSEYTIELIKEYHKMSDDKIILIKGGVDIERFCPAEDKFAVRSELNLPLDKKILLTVRNLVPRMGLENLLCAFSEVLKDDKNIFLVIGGAGYLEKKLKELANDLRINNFVNFAGFIPDELLPKYYQSADLFILPTYALEGFGLVTIEALSCGLPVLGTPVGGTVEILSKLDLLFDSNSKDAMVRKIKEFLRLDKKEVENLSNKCRQYVVENYSWDKIIDKIEEIFYSLKRRKDGYR